ncbi:preprotein translocase subunit YajC [Corynebacterium aquilae]|uniref:preprotein translocase subunit YajC n=1 Tax=Corynebacterium aquilae TaxID=203263 RepID=UPI000951F6EE|nr:preprotein translocase subunit YajC [Corynebacterium aquilae]
MNLSLLILLLVIFLVPTILQVRRQKARLNEMQQLQASLGVGDRVVTAAGLHGVVVALADGVVTLEISEGVSTNWDRAAIVSRQPAPVVPGGDAGASAPEHEA